MLSFAEAYAELEIQYDGTHPSPTIIKNAFKKMALKYHPDKNKSPDAEEKFKMILKAYETLEKKIEPDAEEYTFSSTFGTYYDHHDEPIDNFFEEKFEDLLDKLFNKNSDEQEQNDDQEETLEDRSGAELVESRAAVWEEEAKRTPEERRARYFCGKDYITVESVQDWPTYFMNNKNIELLEQDEPRVACDDDIARKVALVSGSVAHFEADAILSSVNEWLMRGGGVDGYVRQSAGGKIEWELSLSGYLSCGETVITRGYRLPAQYVIHCCGPCGPNAKGLALCYKSALDLAVKHNIRTIGMCGISAGNNGYPLIESTRVAMKTIRKWLEQDNNKNKIDKIVFVCFRKYEMKAYEKWMQKYFPSSLFLGESRKEIDQGEKVNENENNDNENNDNDNDDNDLWNSLM